MKHDISHGRLDLISEMFGMADAFTGKARNPPSDCDVEAYHAGFAEGLRRLSIPADERVRSIEANIVRVTH
jgi:hypothetical protein